MLRTHTLRRLVTAACAGSALASFAAPPPRRVRSNTRTTAVPPSRAAAPGSPPRLIRSLLTTTRRRWRRRAPVSSSASCSRTTDVCYSRKNPGNVETGPNQGTAADDPEARAHYIPVCNNTTTQPRIIPSLGIVWRATRRAGTRVRGRSAGHLRFDAGRVAGVRRGASWATGRTCKRPAPYRYMTVGNRSTILHPTFSAGYELGGGLSRRRRVHLVGRSDRRRELRRPHHVPRATSATTRSTTARAACGPRTCSSPVPWSRSTGRSRTPSTSPPGAAGSTRSTRARASST